MDLPLVFGPFFGGSVAVFQRSVLCSHALEGRFDFLPTTSVVCVALTAWM